MDTDTQTTYTDKQLEDLKQGYYGYVICHGRAPDGRLLIECQLASQDDDGWECADWHLVNDSDTSKDVLDQTQHIAYCDGYNGIDWQIDLDDLDEDMQEYLDDTVRSYNITGDLLAECIAASHEAVDDDTPDEDTNNGQGYKIWIEPNYYPGTCNAPTAHYYNEDYCYNDAAIFDTAGEARAWIEEKHDDTYYLSHGEYGRPSYTIVKA